MRLFRLYFLHLCSFFIQQAVALDIEEYPDEFTSFLVNYLYDSFKLYPSINILELI